MKRDRTNKVFFRINEKVVEKQTAKMAYRQLCI